MALLLLVYQRGKWALITLSTTGQWWESIPDPKCCIDGTRIFTATSFITAKAWAQHQLPSLTECSYDYRCEWYKQTFKIYSRDFPSCPVVKICLPMQGTWTQSRVGELRSHMPRGNWARMPQWIPSTAKKKRIYSKEKKKRPILKFSRCNRCGNRGTVHEPSTGTQVEPYHWQVCDLWQITLPPWASASSSVQWGQDSLSCDPTGLCCCC